MKLTENFSLEEFACKDGVSVPAMYWANVQELANNLQVLRDKVKAPITINSAYRHSDYNKAVGGTANSKHLTAEAADIVVKGMTSYEVYAMIVRLIELGEMKQGGLGLYSNFVHYDIRGAAARWNFS